MHAALPWVWLRFPDEATKCPGCASESIRTLDVLPVHRDIKGRRTLFVSGCEECGLLFTNPVPTSDQLEHYYGDEGPYRTHVVEAAEARRLERKKRPRAAQRPVRAADRLLNAIAPYVPVHQPRPGARALDFGCGDGKFLDRLQDRGWETYGIEPSTSVAFGRHQRLTAPPQDGSFDFVIVHHVLEHLTDPLAVLKQLAGAMRVGGFIFISIPSLDALPRHRLLRYCIDGRKHVVSYSERCLFGYLARVGIAVSARVDSSELDAALTKGQPLRLRLIGTRTTSQLRPDASLAPALSALRRYHGTKGLMRRVVPVRLRAALADRARERSRARHF
jgi:SAM-dependent methyltransferase